MTMTDRRDYEQQRAPVLTETEARQGVTRHNVRYVLFIGTAAVIVAFAIIYIAFFA
jgi:hypothetical protein